MSLANGVDVKSSLAMKIGIATVLLLAVLAVGACSVSDEADATAEGTCTLTFEFGTYSVGFDVSAGSIVEPPPMVPVKPSEEGVAYTFVGWSGYTEGMVATGDMVFTAMFKADNTDTVTVYYNDGTSEELYIVHGDRLSGGRSVFKYYLDEEMTVAWSMKKAVTRDTVLYAIVSDSGVAGEGVEWSIDFEDCILYIVGEGEMTDWASQSEVLWSRYCSAIEQVIVSEGVTSIGDNAFRNCTVLYSVVLPDSVERLGKYSFYRDTALESISFGDSLRTVGKNSFSGLSLIYSDGSVAPASLYAGCVFEGSLKVLECNGFTKYLTDTLEWSMDFDSGTLTVSGTGDMPDYSSMTAMPWYPIRKSVETVVIGNGVVHVGDKSFPDFPSLKTIRIGEDVESIGTYAFRKCVSLETLYVSSSLTSLGSVAFTNRFAYPDGTGITLETSNLAGRTFVSDGTDMVLSEIRGTIGEVSWKLDCISECLVVFGEGSTGNCSNVKSVPWYAYRSMVRDVVIENGVTWLTDYAFYSYPDLESVVMGDSVAGIGINSIRGCGELKALTFGSSLSKIGSNALMGLVFHDIDGKAMKTSAAKLAGVAFIGGPKDFYQGEFVTVTFMVDGSVYDTEAVIKGHAVAAPDVPVKPSEGGFVYTFEGWSLSSTDYVPADLSAVSSNLVVYAYYKVSGGDCKYSNVKVYIENVKGTYDEVIVSADSINDAVNIALTSLNKGKMVLSEDGTTIVSVDGREAGYNRYWVIHQWLPLGTPGWGISLLDGTGDDHLKSGATICLHISTIEYDAKGKQYYSYPEFSPESTGYVFIRFYVDYDSDEPEVQDAFTEEIRHEGFWLKGTGTNLGEVLVSALESNSFSINYYCGEDGNGNSLQYWIDSMFGKGDVLLDDDSWKYWIQFSYVNGEWGYNGWTIGYYDPGVYPYLMLVYAISDVDAEELDVGEMPDVTDVENKVIHR